MPALLLAIVGIGYVMVVKAPTYQAQSTYILVPGAAPPSTAQIAKDPALGRLNSTNPFEEYGDISVVGEMLIQTMSSPSEAAVLAGQGVPGSYTVAPDTSTFGSSPIVEITAEGPTATVASNAAALVGGAMQNKLAAVQAAQGISRPYWIGLLELARPDHPQAQLSSKLRDLVAVIAADVILLFVIVSILNAREERKRESLRAEPAGEVNGWSHHEVEPMPSNLIVPRAPEVAASGDQIDAELQQAQQDPQHVGPPLLNSITRRRWHRGNSDEATARAQQQSASRHPD
jgi:hypothetical protein